MEMVGDRTGSQGKKERAAIGFGFGGILKGLGDLIERLGELAEKGGELSKEGTLREFSTDKGVKGVYGFSIKVGLGGEDVKIEPFGNIRTDDKTGKSVVQEVREPMVDTFEEEDHILIVAEMPGIGEKDMELDLSDDILTISATRGDKKYHKEILLPRTFDKKKMSVSCNNGVVKIKLLK